MKKYQTRHSTTTTWKSASTDKAKRLADYRQRLRQADFKRVSAYISGELVSLLESQKHPGECLGRMLERLLLGSATLRPQFYTDEEIAAKKERQQGRAAKRAARRKMTRAEQRVLRRGAWEKAKREVMKQFGSAS